MDTKTCRNCGVEKPLKLFHASKAGIGNRKATCAECCAAKKKAVYDVTEKLARKALKDAYIARTTKVCRVCGIEKPKNQFYTAKVNADGYRNECGACINSVARALKGMS